MKLKKTLSAALFAAGLAAVAGAASAAAVNPISYASFSGSLVSFNELVTDPDGSLFEGLLSSGGVQFGERFQGQVLSSGKQPGSGPGGWDWFDNLDDGAPSAGLTLLAGATGRNLGAFDYGDALGTALVGIGPAPGTFPASYDDVFGFGAISARFATGQSMLGFQLRDAGSYGYAALRLYRADGSLIQTVDLGRLDPTGEDADIVTFAYARDGGVADIAGFTLTHTDPYYGVALDNLKYSAAAAPVPEPGSMALLLAGLLAVGGIARRRAAA